MLSPAKMKKMDVLVLEKDLHRVTESLGELGAVQLSEARHTDQAELLHNLSASDRLQLAKALLEKAAILAKRLHIDQPEEAEAAEFMPIEVIEDRLNNIEDDVRRLLDQEDKVDAEIESLNDTLTQIRSFRRLNVPVEQIPQFSFLHFVTGSLDEEALASFQQEAGPQVVVIELEHSEDGVVRIAAITSKKNRWAMESTLEKFDFRPENLSEHYEGVPQEIYDQSEGRLEQLRNKKDELTAALTEQGKRYVSELNRYRRRLHIEQKVLQAEEFFGRTSSTCVITGWVPAVRVDEINRRLADVTGNRAVVEFREPRVGQEDIPTLMRHSRLIKPFEILVSNYGFPSYLEIEPTIFVGLSFLIMFGWMFGDVGQGAVLAIAGLVLARAPVAENLRKIGSLTVFAGIFAIGGGFMYGEFFGAEFPPLWMHVMKGTHPLTLLGWSVAFGTLMISLGLILNIINCLRRGDMLGAILDRNGVVGLIFYWGVLWIVVQYMVRSLGDPSGWQFAVLMGAPVLVILLKIPIMKHLLHKEPEHSGGDAVIESGMDVFEMVVNFLSNTVSFVRVGAFALAHGGLAIATYQLAKMASAATGEWVEIAIIVIGNIFIIVFEGLIVSIQCLRLEYYEFFTKFFKGEGKPFNPFRLRPE